MQIRHWLLLIADTWYRLMKRWSIVVAHVLAHVSIRRVNGHLVVLPVGRLGLSGPVLVKVVVHRVCLRVTVVLEGLLIFARFK